MTDHAEATVRRVMADDKLRHAVARMGADHDRLICVAAHLGTVFPAGTNLKVRRAAGLATVLAVAGMV